MRLMLGPFVLGRARRLVFCLQQEKHPPPKRARQPHSRPPRGPREQQGRAGAGQSEGDVLPRAAAARAGHRQRPATRPTPDPALNNLTVTGGVVNAAGAVDHDMWNGYARDPQHTGDSTVAAQPIQAIHWQTPVDLSPQYSGNDLLIHYGSPVVTQANTVVVPVKTGAAGGFQLEGINGTTGAVQWTQASDYVLPPHNWVPSYTPTLTPSGKLYYAGKAGSIYIVNAPDGVGATSTGPIYFYGQGLYNSSPAAFDAHLFSTTPVTSAAQGN